MKYLDLSKVTNGDGSESTPWQPSQVNNVSITDDLKVKGLYDSASGAFSLLAAGYTIENWLAHEPWRLGSNSYNLTINAGTIRNGIFTAYGNISLNATGVYGCHFMRTGTGETILTSAASVRGCCFCDTTLVTFSQYSAINDSLFTGANGIINPGYTDLVFTNCAFSDTGPFGTRQSMVNCQTSWNSPSLEFFPDWKSPRAKFLFLYNMIKPGGSNEINSGVWSGGFPYTGYDKDLWGEDRSGIGALNFHDLPETPVSYFVKNGGEQIDPYDSISKASSTLGHAMLNAPLASGDIMEVVNNGIIDDSAATITVPSGIIVRSYGTNGTDRLTNKPTIYLGGSQISLLQGANLIGLQIYYDAVNTWLLSIASDCTVESNSFLCTNETTSMGITASVSPTNARICLNSFRHFYYGVSIGFADLSNLQIINNVFYDCQFSIQLACGVQNPAIQILNNIFSVGDVAVGLTNQAQNAIHDFNLFHNISSTNYVPPVVAGSNDRIGDPLFENAASGNFKLMRRSACIDVGIGAGTYANVPTTDAAGNSRPIIVGGYPIEGVRPDDGTDIGAYEFIPRPIGVAVSTIQHRYQERRRRRILMGGSLY